MTTRIAIELPSDPRLVDENGNVTYAWRQFFEQVGLGTRKVRDGAQLMDDLSAATTVTQVRTAWEELRAKLLEIL